MGVYLTHFKKHYLSLRTANPESGPHYFFNFVTGAKYETPKELPIQMFESDELLFCPFFFDHHHITIYELEGAILLQHLSSNQRIELKADKALVIENTLIVWEGEKRTTYRVDLLFE